jgi:hypothetical protein
MSSAGQVIHSSSKKKKKVCVSLSFVLETSSLAVSPFFFSLSKEMEIDHHHSIFIAVVNHLVERPASSCNKYWSITHTQEKKSFSGVCPSFW